MKPEADKKYIKLRERMVRKQIAGRGITSDPVLAAIGKVPRHFFVPVPYVNSAYEDRPLPLGPNQTISQPYVVALMIEKLELQASDRVLEIGTGSGYETALLAEIAKEVYSLEVDPLLAERAKKAIAELDYSDVYIRAGNGFSGWPEAAPFDKIILSAAPDHLPRQLIKQLKLGGRMILPLGEDWQVLVSIDKTSDGLESKEWGGVRFVGMVPE